jgi:hypothetical protein
LAYAGLDKVEPWNNGTNLVELTRILPVSLVIGGVLIVALVPIIRFLNLYFANHSLFLRLAAQNGNVDVISTENIAILLDH